jgi:hypothetical protein
MTKEMGPSAETLAAINKIAAEGDADMRRRIGLKPKDMVIPDPTVQVVEVPVSKKSAVVDAVPKVKKREPEKKVHHPKVKKSTVVTSSTGAGRHQGGRVGNKAAKEVSKKIAASVGTGGVEPVKPVVQEVKKDIMEQFPEWGITHDSVYESRTMVPVALDKTTTTSAVLGQQEMTSVHTHTEKDIPVLTDVVEEPVVEDASVLTDRAAEEARARLEQLHEEEGTLVVETTLGVDDVPTIEAAPTESKVGKLREAAAESRKKYAERMYEHERLSESLKRSAIGRFLKLGSDADNRDLEYWRLDYEEKLAALREAELEEIKQSGLKGQELKEAMAGLLRASKVDEVLSLISDRDAYRLEGNELSDKVYNVSRSIIEKYNKLQPKYKIMAGAAIGLLSLGTAMYGGAALGAGAMLARRFFSSAGFSVAIDATLDAKTKERFKKQAEEEIMAELERMFDPVGPFQEGVVPSEHPEEGMMQAFEERLRAASGGVTLAFEDQLFKRKLNGVAGVAAGVGLGFVGSAAAEWFKESGAADATHDIILGQDAVPVEMTEAELAERTAAAREMAEEYGSASPERQLDIRSATSMTDGQLSALAKTIQIEGGNYGLDTPAASGVDKIAIDAKEGELAHAVADNPSSLERTPLLEEDAYAKELERVRAEAQYEATQGKEMEEVLEIDTSKWSNIDGSAVHDRTEFIEIPPEAGADIPTVIADTYQPEAVFTPELQPRVDGWFSQIFRADGEMLDSGHDWVFDREKLGKIGIRDMMRDAMLYDQGATSGYRTGLSAEQLKNFAGFFQNAYTNMDDQKALAMINMDTMRPGRNMTVMEYLKKVAPLAKRGQRFGLFTTSV